MLAGPPTPVGLVVAGPLPAWVPEAIARIRGPLPSPSRSPIPATPATPALGGRSAPHRPAGHRRRAGQVVGIDPRRVARVAEVVRRWEAGGAGS
ncbi:MAG: hypothetical protein R2711_08620 [Acidimicrobiales bacterium]